MKKLFYTGLVACSIVLTSCGDKKEDAAATAAAAKANLGPLETVEAIRDDISAAKVSNIWAALPASYREDAEGLVHTFGEKVDKELYDKGIETVTKLNSLLKSKKSIIIDMVNENAPADQKEKLKAVLENWDNITGLLDSLLSSDLKNTDGLKSADIAQLLADLEPKLKPLIEAAKKSAPEGEFEKFTSAKFTQVSQDGDKAVLSLDGEEKTFMKVEDRWIPEDMVKNWSKGITEAKKGLNEFEKMKPSEKQQVLMMMGMAQGALTTLEETKTKEEFMAAVGGLMKQFGGMF